jgi:hypothetical protein
MTEPAGIDRSRLAKKAADVLASSPAARRVDAALGDAGRLLGLGDYLRAAFKEPYNLILLAGGVLAGVVTLMPMVVWPIVGALELLYLFGVGTNPRYQAVVRARQRGMASGGGATATAPEPQQLVASLSADRQQRFEAVRRRCVNLQRAIRQHAGQGSGSLDMGAILESSQQDSINQLLLVFLRTLTFEQVLDTFVSSMPKKELESTLERTKAALADPATSEKMRAAHSENLAVLEKRLENLRHAEENREMIRARLVRVENSILLIQEQAITRQDPGFIEAEVSAVTAGLSSVQEMVQAMDLPQLAPTTEGPVPDFLRGGPLAAPVASGVPPLPPQARASRQR